MAKRARRLGRPMTTLCSMQLDYTAALPQPVPAPRPPGHGRHQGPAATDSAEASAKAPWPQPVPRPPGAAARHRPTTIYTPPVDRRTRAVVRYRPPGAAARRRPTTIYTPPVDRRMRAVVRYRPPGAAARRRPTTFMTRLWIGGPYASNSAALPAAAGCARAAPPPQSGRGLLCSDWPHSLAGARPIAPSVQWGNWAPRQYPLARVAGH